MRSPAGARRSRPTTRTTFPPIAASSAGALPSSCFPGCDALDLHLEGREVRVPVVVILVLDALQEGDDAVGDGRHEYFPAALQQVLHQRHLDDVRRLPDAVEGDEVEQR